jgi:hypothetical protein
MLYSINDSIDSWRFTRLWLGNTVPQLVSRLQGCFTCKEIHADGDLTGEELLQVPNGGDLHRTLSKTSTTAPRMAPARKTKTRRQEDKTKTEKTEKAKEPLYILGIPYVRFRDDGAHVHESDCRCGEGHHGCRSCGLQIHQAYTPKRIPSKWI